MVLHEFGTRCSSAWLETASASHPAASAAVLGDVLMCQTSCAVCHLGTTFHTGFKALHVDELCIGPSARFDANKFLAGPAETNQAFSKYRRCSAFRSKLILMLCGKKAKSRSTKSGWWFQPLWKILISQLGRLFPICGNIKNVPNHQPEVSGSNKWTHWLICSSSNCFRKSPQIALASTSDSYS